LGWSFASSPSAFIQAGGWTGIFGRWVGGWFDFVRHEFYDDLLIWMAMGIPAWSGLKKDRTG
jgi:hypothetical protein